MLKKTVRLGKPADDAKLCTIGEGTSEIQKPAIAKGLSVTKTDMNYMNVIKSS